MNGVFLWGMVLWCETYRNCLSRILQFRWNFWELFKINCCSTFKLHSCDRAIFVLVATWLYLPCHCCILCLLLHVAYSSTTNTSHLSATTVITLAASVIMFMYVVGF